MSEPSQETASLGSKKSYFFVAAAVLLLVVVGMVTS